jgi:hypothetical protein
MDRFYTKVETANGRIEVYKQMYKAFFHDLRASGFSRDEIIEYAHECANKKDFRHLVIGVSGDCNLDDTFHLHGYDNDGRLYLICNHEGRSCKYPAYGDSRGIMVLLFDSNQMNIIPNVYMINDRSTRRLKPITGNEEPDDKFPVFAAIREVKEEIGLSLEPEDLEHVGTWHVSNFIGWKSNRNEIFRATIPPGFSLEGETDGEVIRGEWVLSSDYVEDFMWCPESDTRKWVMSTIVRNICPCLGKKHVSWHEECAYFTDGTEVHILFD